MFPRDVLFCVPALLIGMTVSACGDRSSLASPTSPDLLIGATASIAGRAGYAGTNGSMSGGMMGPGMGGGMNGPGIGGGVTSEFVYLTMMIPHHQEAIEAATVLQSGTSRQEMRDFAAAIIRTQSAEVNQMQAWLAQWYPALDTTVTYHPMMRDLTGLAGDTLDLAFLEDMIPHHMMAVMMSQQLLMRRVAVHQAVVPFAANIRDTQNAEIRTMRTWLHQWFGW